MQRFGQCKQSLLVSLFLHAILPRKAKGDMQWSGRQAFCQLKDAASQGLLCREHCNSALCPAIRRNAWLNRLIIWQTD